MGSWRRHSREFKQQAVERMKSSGNIHELARELGVERKLLYTWKYQFEGRSEKKHANYGGGQPAASSVETRLRRGWQVNHKRVVRLLREDNLLAIRHRRFILTTDSEHALEVYLNLAKRMRLTAANPLWVADLTYIRLQREFVYWAVILDKRSRRVVGWALDRSLAARLAVTALERAITARQPAPGLVHHSDRGSPYASPEYVSVLENTL